MFERSGYAAGYYLSTDPKGHDRLLIVVKRTFKLDAVEAKCTPLDKVEPILTSDQYVGDEDAFKSSVEIENDVAPWKLAKDIVFVGKAYAPGGKKAKTWDVSLRVGPHAKRARIFGPRKVTWVPPKEGKGKDAKPEIQPPLIGEPEPIAEVALTYENAYGGFATYYPPDPEQFRKAIRKQKKQEKKKEAEKKAEAEKKVEAEKEKAAEAKKVADKKKKAEEEKAWFMGGDKKIADAPDVPLEVEIGSRRLKSKDGTVVLELAEIAEADERDAKAEYDKSDKEAADAKRKERDDLAETIDELALAKLAAADTAAATAEREARARAVRLKDESGTRLIDLADAGDAIEADADWVETEKKKRDELYESLGLDPDEEVEWMEGDFPRIPCPTNFVGKGFALGPSKEALDGLEMPLIEDPDKPIQPEDLSIDPGTMHLGGVIRPAGLGVVHRCWQPRCYFGGYFPNEMEDAQHALDKQLAGLDPDKEEDQPLIKALVERTPQPLDPRLHNGAAFQVPTLFGDEEVYLENLDKSGMTFFKLPGRFPFVRLDRGKGWEKVEVVLDTLVIDREGETVALVWRGGVKYGGPKELDTYPRLDIDVQDFSVVEWRDKEERLAIARRKKRGEALVLGVDEIDPEEAALFDKRIEQAAIGLHGVKENIHHDREDRAGDGALYDLQDQEDVVTNDADWVEKAQTDMMSEEEKKAFELARDEKKAVQAQKEKLKARLLAIDEEKRLKAEAEAAANAKKKKKPKKGEDKPAADDDDDDEGGEDPPPTPAAKG